MRSRPQWVMGSSNRASVGKPKLSVSVCRVQGRRRGRHEPPHDGLGEANLCVACTTRIDLAGGVPLCLSHCF